MNCYDTYLPSVYKKEGFHRVSTMDYNPDFEPDGFDRDYMYSTYPNINKKLVFISLKEKDLKDFGDDWDEAENYAKS